MNQCDVVYRENQCISTCVVLLILWNILRVLCLTLCRAYDIIVACSSMKNY